MAQQTLELVDLSALLHGLQIAKVPQGGQGQESHTHPAKYPDKGAESFTRRRSQRLHQQECAVAREDAEGKTEKEDDPLLIAHRAKTGHKQVEQIVEEGVAPKREQQGHDGQDDPEYHLAPGALDEQGRGCQDQRQDAHILGRPTEIAWIQQMNHLCQGKAPGHRIIVQPRTRGAGNELQRRHELDCRQPHPH